MSQPEQDPRIYMAAERTFLAWIRTGLALMGFGFVVARFGLFLREVGAGATGTDGQLHSSAFSLWTGTALVLAGVVANVISATQYAKIVRELKSGSYVPGMPSRAGLTLAVLLAAVGVGMAFYLTIVR
jgi:putative membrane protein